MEKSIFLYLSTLTCFLKALSGSVKGGLCCACGRPFILPLTGSDKDLTLHTRLKDKRRKFFVRLPKLSDKVVAITDNQ
jgi:hypothetical protein